MEKRISKHHKLHIRRGDRVKILAGKHKNEQGVVIQVLPDSCRAIVKGMRMVVHYLKPSAQSPRGSMGKKEAPIHISNLMVVDPTTQQPTRIGRRCNDLGKLQRYAKKTGNFIKNDQV